MIYMKESILRELEMIEEEAENLKAILRNNTGAIGLINAMLMRINLLKSMIKKLEEGV